MARGYQADPQVKALAIGALMAGQGVDSVAKEYNIPSNTAKSWRRIAAERLKIIGESKDGEDPYGVLLDAYLVETLKTLRAQQEHFRDKEWMNRQPADSMAILHGVTADKAMRVLEAIEKARGE